MPHHKVGTSVRESHDGPSALAHALDAVAIQHFERDQHRRRLFREASRSSAAIHAEKLLALSPAHLKLLPPLTEPTNRTNAEGRKESPAPGEIDREFGQPVTTQRQLELAGQEMIDRYINTILPTASSPDLSRIIGAHAGAPETQNRSNPTQRLKPVIAGGQDDAQAQSTSEPGGNTDSIGGLPSRYTAPLPVYPENSISAQRTRGPEAAFTMSSAGSVTSRHIQRQTETLASEQFLLISSSQDHGLYPGPRSLRPSDQRPRASRLLSSEGTIGSILASLGDVIGANDRRSDPIDPRMNLDLHGGWNTDNGPSSNTGTNGSARAVIAAVADELERLRAAVRRTIDDLERVRGTVQPSLPALPPNRGAFRIS